MHSLLDQAAQATPASPALPAAFQKDQTAQKKDQKGVGGASASVSAPLAASLPQAVRDGAGIGGDGDGDGEGGAGEAALERARASEIWALPQRELQQRRDMQV